jgi:DNA-binding NtrC family response regulator
MSPSVLVVDDDKLIRWSLSERLARRGYETKTADSGEDALGMVSATWPEVMLLDVRLTGMDGVQTLQRALAVNPELVVVMISAHGTVDTAVEAMKHGAVDFLEKPFALSLLDAAVERALASAATRRQIAQGRMGAEESSSIVGQSGAMETIRTLVRRIASTEGATVLIEGESGVGKEAVARELHFNSPRAAKPFMQVNCAALPEQLLESELFGHERGAFTDAKVQKRGLFEMAGQGTVMLDEIGDLPAGGQAKLLRLLENKTFRRVGGVTELRTEARVVAATNADLEERVSTGRFRADLFFRLNVVRLLVPPLRERREDIPLLAAHFVSRYNETMKRTIKGISPTALDLLMAYSWPGNVRELRNVIERAFILHPGIEEIRSEHLAEPIRGAPPLDRLEAGAPLGSPALSLDAAERRLIHEAMEKAKGNQSQAARMLGVSRDTLRYRLKKFGGN